MGIDPGMATTGYGVLDKLSAPCNRFGRNGLRIVDYGAITTSSRKSMAHRLVDLHDRVTELIDQFVPNVVVMEQLFFAKNQTTAIAVGKACGVIQFAVARKGMQVVEYTPMEVKQAVVGYGGAEKRQVQYMIQQILGLAECPKPDDAADALALCICHANSEKLRAAFD